MPRASRYFLTGHVWHINSPLLQKRVIKIDTHSLKMHSAITQSSKNEKVVLIDGIKGAIRLFYVKQPVSL